MGKGAVYQPSLSPDATHQVVSLLSCFTGIETAEENGMAYSHPPSQPSVWTAMPTGTPQGLDVSGEEGRGRKRQNVISPLPFTFPLHAARDRSLTQPDLAHHLHPYLMDKCYSIWGFNNL